MFPKIPLCLSRVPCEPHTESIRRNSKESLVLSKGRSVPDSQTGRAIWGDAKVERHQ
jgi:hypothetical protein